MYCVCCTVYTYGVCCMYVPTNSTFGLMCEFSAFYLCSVVLKATMEPFLPTDRYVGGGCPYEGGEWVCPYPHKGAGWVCLYPHEGGGWVCLYLHEGGG